MANPILRRGFWQLSRVVLDIVASLAVVIGAIVVLAPLGSGKKNQARTPPPSGIEIPIPSQPVSLQGAGLIGAPAAKAVLLEFSDFECPYCGKFSVEILPVLQERYIQNGLLLLAFRHLPLKIHPNAEAAAVAAACAAAQGKFAPFHDLLFTSRSGLDPSSLTRHAATAGIETSAYRACLDRTGPDQVAADTALARSLGVNGTPAFFVGTRGSDQKLVVRRTIRGARDLGAVVGAIDGDH
jgi:protein-disulfide isomerase